MKRRTIITAALLGAALTVGLILYLCTQLDSSRVTVTSTGPLDIRLWGIRPDAGDAIYDPNGKKIMDTLGVANGDKTVWKSDLYRHDFIFETPATDEPFFCNKLQYLVNGSTFWPGNFAQRRFRFEHKGRTLWWFQTTISRTTRKSLLFGLWKKDVPVDRIGLNLKYYFGPPHKPICTFKGPFRIGRKMADEAGLYRISFVANAAPAVPDLYLYMKRRASPFPPRALFYDAAGKRHFSGNYWSPADPNMTVIKCRLPSLPLEDIVLITIGEEPFEITVRNLNLSSPNGERRTHAERLDRIAERLELERDPKRLERYRFKGPSEILKVLDVIRGDQIPVACGGLCVRYDGKSGFERSNLSAEQLQRLRRTALRWAGAMDPEIRASAAKLGLHCGWPEFVDVALCILESPDRHRSRTAARDAATGLRSFEDQLNEKDVERIAEFLLRRTDSRNNALRMCLEHRKSPARVAAMWDLAASEHLWLWCPAITRLSTWRELDGKHDSLPEELKVRAFLKLGPSGFSDPNQIAPRASDLLLSLLSSELLTRYGRAYASLLLNVPENIDRREMTDVMIESLRNAEYGPQGYSFSVAIGRIVKHLNQWYDVDIGGLSSDVKKRDARLYRKYMDTVASEALRWYDTVYTGADPNALR